MIPLGVSAFFKRVPLWAWIALAVAVALFLAYRALDAYGDRQYQAGKDDADKAWKAASDKLIDKAQESGKKADVAAAARTADYAAKVEDEKEKIDEAIADGSSPFDVMFGPR